MGQKVHPLIFRGLIYKNYLNNFYINISKNKYYLINILLTYFIYYNMYRICNYKEDNLPFTINDLDEMDEYFLNLYSVLINNINENTYVIEYRATNNIFNFRGYYTKNITGSCNLSDAKIFNSKEEADNTCEILNEKDKNFLKDFIMPYIDLQFYEDFKNLTLVLSEIKFEVKRLVVSN